MRGAMQPFQIVAEAAALEANEVFTTQFDQLRAEAIAGLVETDAQDVNAMRNHQAMVRAIDKIRANVRILALTNAPPTKSGLA